MVDAEVVGDAERLGRNGPDRAGELAEGVVAVIVAPLLAVHPVVAARLRALERCCESALPISVRLPDLVDRREVARLQREVEPDGVVANVVTRQEVGGLLRVALAVRNGLHDLCGEALRNPRFIIYDKWVTYTLADIGWLAGIIDGEGTVSLVNGQSGPILRIGIYNGDAAVLDKVHRIYDALGVRSFDHWDSRAAKACCLVNISTSSVLAIYKVIRPHMTRQVARLDAAVSFLEPCYEGRSRVHWTAAQRAEWEALRSRFNAA